MTKAEEAARKAYPYDGGTKGWICKSSRPIFINGYEQSQQDIIALIQSRIDEILGDAQPNPILRMELHELIKKIEA